jgi:hypothetical protein
MPFCDPSEFSGLERDDRSGNAEQPAATSAVVGCFVSMIDSFR